MTSTSERIYNEGAEDGARNNMLENVRSLVRNLKVSARQALEILDVPEAEQGKYLSMLDGH